MVKSYVPERGDFVYINFNPQSGHEQSGFRPLLILSPKAYQIKSGLCLACPVTNSVKGYPFEVACGSDEISGVILADQVKCLDWKTRNVKFCSKAKKSVLDETVGKLSVLIVG